MQRHSTSTEKRSQMRYEKLPDSERQTKGTGDASIIGVWRGINIFMMIFFALAALANSNDGDWYLWVPIYLVPAVLCVPVILNPTFSEHPVIGGLSAVHFTLCLAYSLYQFILMIQAVSGQWGDNPLKLEEGREIVGLFIIIAWLGISRFTSLGRPSAVSKNRSMIYALIIMSVTLAAIPLVVWGSCFVGDWHKHLGHCSGMFGKK